MRRALTAWVVLLLSACSALAGSAMERRQTETLRHLVILYTNDEHGWMEPYQNTSGAAGMLRLWKYREGWGDNDHLLILSGGDMWTGPALSTVLEGESMADVMNRMGYQAAAIGNHDFDFGQDALRDRLAQSQFPFLSANIRVAATGEIPDFAQPYTVIEVNGVQVGIIGLTTTETKVDTKPAHVADLEFLDYRDVIPTFARQARADGAELLMVIAHVCAVETRQIAPLAAEHGVRIIGGGHCHEEVNEVVDGVRLIESGFFMRGYARIELLFDTRAGEILQLESNFVGNRTRPFDAQVLRVMEEWRARTDAELWEMIGYADRSIDRQSPEMAALLLRPWLEAWPSADIALAEPRYVQQDLYPGLITPATIVGLLSTSNELVEIEITGKELIELVASRQPLVAGLLEGDGYRLSSGEAVDPNATYRVLLPHTIYAGGFHHEFAGLDASPVFTGIDWRQPPIDWVHSVSSSGRAPLQSWPSEEH